ncbi:MAG: hypothetical protein HC844_03575 [Tabrizicola sp.]|nr:hypothetical protein [Tabrizicola sp.]
MITSTGALILLVFALPIAVWVSWSDMRSLKIPNKAVIAMAAVWPLVGWLAVPTWQAWFWGFALMAIVFVLGYLAFMFMRLGAGDAKFAAAMAPVFVGADYTWVLSLVAACLIGALVTHRILRVIPPIRKATPDWKSWDERLYFPLGFALAGILVFYLVAAFMPQL